MHLDILQQGTSIVIISNSQRPQGYWFDGANCYVRKTCPDKIQLLASNFLTPSLFHPTDGKKRADEVRCCCYGCYCCCCYCKRRNHKFGSRTARWLFDTESNKGSTSQRVCSKSDGRRLDGCHVTKKRSSHQQTQLRIMTSLHLKINKIIIDSLDYNVVIFIAVRVKSIKTPSR